jgi:Trm5-related predicted tRNA methylase
MSKYQSKISQKATYLRVYDGGRMLYGDEVTDVIHNLEKRIVELQANQERAEKLIFELHEQVYDSEYLDNQVELYEALKEPRT